MMKGEPNINEFKAYLFIAGSDHASTDFTRFGWSSHRTTVLADRQRVCQSLQQHRMHVLWASLPHVHSSHANNNNVLVKHFHFFVLI